MGLHLGGGRIPDCLVVGLQDLRALGQLAVGVLLGGEQLLPGRLGVLCSAQCLSLEGVQGHLGLL